MFKIFETSAHDGFAMPISWTGVVAAAAVRTLPAMGGVSIEAAAGSKRRDVDVAPVCAYTQGTDVFVLEGAFPGTSAWSPPI